MGDEQHAPDEVARRMMGSSSTALPSAASAWVMALRLASAERSPASERAFVASARSARAALTGSSLARSTRLLLLTCACVSASSRWRCASCSIVVS